MAELFVSAGHTVRGLVRRTSRTQLLERLGVEIFRGDLKDCDSLRRAVEGVELVVHAATTMSGIPQEYVESTVKGSLALLAAAEKAGVRRFVHISSISVYKLGKLAKGKKITEDSPYEDDPSFLTNYSRSKIDAERAALHFGCDGTMQVIVLRPGILYGPRGKWQMPRIGYALGKNWYVVIGNGRNLLPVCYVSNCARAALLAAESTEARGGVFNILDDQLFTQREYLDHLKKVRIHLKTIRFPYILARALGGLTGVGMRLLGRSNPFHPAHLVGCHVRLTYSNEKARGVLGWHPQTPKETALAETMQYHARQEQVSRRANLGLLGQGVQGKPPITACLVGCGVIAETHLHILRGMKNAKVMAVSDVSQEAARKLAQRFGVPHIYEDVEKMLDAEKPGVLHILTPPQSHVRYAEIAARRGCNVLVEKPMAVNALEARQMEAHAVRHGVQICVDHNHLYDPVVVRARRLVESGALGDIIWVESYYGFNLGDNPHSRYMLPGGENHWTFELPGGLYHNLVAHPLCLALQLLGMPTRIQAHARYGRVLPHAPTDELRILLETANASGLVTVSLAASPRFQYLNIFGTKMALSVDLLNKWIVPQRVMRGMPKAISRAIVNARRGVTILKGTVGGMIKVLARRWTPFDGMDILIREFYASLQENREPPVSGKEGIEVMEVMDETWRLIGPGALFWSQEGRGKSDTRAGSPANASGTQDDFASESSKRKVQ